MSRIPRILEKGYSYHITIRCNNREFRVTRLECRQVLVYAIKKAIEKYNFKLYGLCIMSNHIHYLMEPKERQDLPRFWVGDQNSWIFLQEQANHLVLIEESPRNSHSPEGECVEYVTWKAVRFNTATSNW
ncbi:transposase [Raphidiopsis sp. BLCC-F218]